jgi:hypothetical protein
MRTWEQVSQFSENTTGYAVPPMLSFFWPSILKKHKLGTHVDKKNTSPDSLLFIFGNLEPVLDVDANISRLEVLEGIVDRETLLLDPGNFLSSNNFLFSIS